MNNPDKIILCLKGCGDTINGACPICGDDVTHTEPPAVFIYKPDNHTNTDRPVCDFCGWKHDSGLMALRNAVVDIWRAIQYGAVSPPHGWRDEHERRANDPEQLRCDLEDAVHRLAYHRDAGPLSRVTTNEVKAALANGDVEVMRKAKELFDDYHRSHRLDSDPIPF